MDLFSGNVAGGVIGAKSAKDIQEGQQQWLEQMSNTAYQRQVADMKAAGINPMVAASKGGGASTPGAPSAANSAPGLISGAIANAARYVNIDKPTADASINLQKEDAAKKKEEQINVRYDSGKKIAEAAEAQSRDKLNKAKAVETLQSAKKLAEDTRVSRTKGDVAEKAKGGLDAIQKGLNSAVSSMMDDDTIESRRAGTPSWEQQSPSHGTSYGGGNSAKRKR